ncbi:MAG: T9SS type A sorting domain-containing protein [Cyclobacteriaceae bacterium]
MKKIIWVLILFLNHVAFAQDWKDFKIPADPGAGMIWELDSAVSDDFNYTSAKSPKSDEFLDKWDDWYHNTWTGPGLTLWRRENSLVEDGVLKLTSNRSGTNRVNLGIIHSNKTVIYPVYIEGRAKIMNSVLANALWLLSPDDTQEIDFMEAYGSSYSENAQRDMTWFAERMHMSHHVFIRDPFTDWQPNDQTSPGYPTWVTVEKEGKNILWREDYHTYGVYWKDPWHLYYYIDGVLVTKKEGKDEIDPVFHTNSGTQGDTQNDTRTGLSKAMDIIIDAEDQDWRSNDAVTPTDAELANTDDHTLKVDWIRAYKPVVNPNPDALAIDTSINDIAIYPNPMQNLLQINADQRMQELSIYRLDGAEVLSQLLTDRSASIDVSLLNSGTYLVQIKLEDGSVKNTRVLKQ